MVFDYYTITNIIYILVVSYACNYMFNYSVIKQIDITNKLAEHNNEILNVNNLTMMKIDKVLNNLTILTQIIDSKSTGDLENIDGLNDKLTTIEHKNDFVDDKIADIENTSHHIYDRLDVVDTRLDCIDNQLIDLNKNLNILLKILQKK